MTYEPKGNGKTRAIEAVIFEEAEPPEHLRQIVHRFLMLRTLEPLEEEYRFHALPDACTYAVFDQADAQIAGVTKLRASSEELNLGKSFHFVNVRFLPGVWQSPIEQARYGQVSTPYAGALALGEVGAALCGQNFAVQKDILSQFVEDLAQGGHVVANPVTEAIFQRLLDVRSVADMAEAAGLSPRQLQRVLKRTTGLAPHDFLKVLRLQQSLHGEPSLAYADQSHFIHSFKKATGYTPARYAKKFDV